MLKGNNVLMLNEATLIAAIEEYLNSRISLNLDKVKVQSVSYATDKQFRVAVTESE